MLYNQLIGRKNLELIETMGHLQKLTLLALVLGITVEVSGYLYDFPGPYCETRPGGCCDSRKDGCAIPISSKFYFFN